MLHNAANLLDRVVASAGKTISAALGHSTISVTANIYVHAIEAMQRGHADRIEAILGEAVAGAMAGPSQVGLKTSVPQQCHVQPLVMKKARKYRPELVAPTGFEVPPSGPGRSVWLLKRPI